MRVFFGGGVLITNTVGAFRALLAQNRFSDVFRERVAIDLITIFNYLTNGPKFTHVIQFINYSENIMQVGRTEPINKELSGMQLNQLTRIAYVRAQFFLKITLLESTSLFCEVN